MANRSFIEKNYTLITREVTLYAAGLVGGAGAVALQQWNYPALGTGKATHNTYTNAAASPANLTSGSSFPRATTGGSEGVRSMTLNGGPPPTLFIKLQDNYQRVLGIELIVENAAGVSTVVSLVKSPDTTGTLMSAHNGSEIGITYSTAAGATGGFAVGDLLLLKLILADSTTP